jgi:hypothetical protein
MPEQAPADSCQSEPDTARPANTEAMTAFRTMVAMAGTVAIEELLDDPLPSDWFAAEAVEARRDHLAAAAVSAGEAMLSLLVGWRLAGAPPAADAPVVAVAGETLLTLHRALITYGHDVPQRNDGNEVVLKSMAENVGVGVARIVLSALAHLRASLQQQMWEYARRRGNSIFRS